MVVAPVPAALPSTLAFGAAQLPLLCLAPQPRAELDAWWCWHVAGCASMLVVGVHGVGVSHVLPL